ncbi:hypothetical protein DSO57_1030304 [Entomophthora muscae]|uniref:Uncharacterized protein n=1 Tax=Entomophthora muscae TaxID=34485 RepID=A0ACC2TBU2_9FUNG|nr:hypothetical protein DSO57_1030304 [Entomophthora muscae]
MMISEGLVADKLPIHATPEQASLEARALELRKASLKLSGFLEDSSHSQRKSFPEYPFFQEDESAASEIIPQVSKEVQTELENEKFAEPAKALDTWAAHLNPQQLLTVICLTFKRMDQAQIETVQKLIELGKNEPAFFFGKLTSKPKDSESSRSQADVETINNLISALSFAEKPIRRASENPFRYSMPITRDFSLTPSRYEPFSSNRDEASLEAGDSFSRPKSFQEDNISLLLSPDWTTASNSPATTTNNISPSINRIRPKSMYEPTNITRTWQQEESSDHRRHLPVGEADALTWNIPLSPTVQKIRHP